jgi:hypothetical protein
MHSNDEGMGESVGGEGAERSVSRASGVEAVETLTNEALLVGTRRLVCQSNRVLATLLAHLGEVEARGLHRTRACASLYIYCIYELRMSEDAAYRRVVAARLVKRFPALFGAVERGELHLTALVLLAPHLTEANVGDVVARAKSRLEFHHHEPFARGGPATPANLSLYCAAHNALAAEPDFGAELAMATRNGYSHFTERSVSQAD